MRVPATKMQKVKLVKVSECEAGKTLIYSLKQGSLSLKRCNLELYIFSTFYTFLFALPKQSSRLSEHSSELLQHFLPYTQELKKPLPTTFNPYFFGQLPQKLLLCINITTPIFFIWNACFFKRRAQNFPIFSRIFAICFFWAMDLMHFVENL